MKKMEHAALKVNSGRKALENEFIALPVGGDCGFYEYFQYKAEEIYKSRGLFTPLAQNMLMLAYPEDCSEGPGYFKDAEFGKFFCSPFNVAKNRIFEGLFAIDISSMINKSSSHAFKNLMSYVMANPNTVYLFFIYSDNTGEIDSLGNAIEQYISVRKSTLSLPDADRLAQYTVSALRDTFDCVDSEAEQVLAEHFAKGDFGYDDAEYLIRQIIASKDYDGTAAKTKTIIDNAPDCASARGAVIFGY